MFLSADYSNYEALVFCDDAGSPLVPYARCGFDGVASFRGKEVVDQFSEIHADLISKAKLYLESLPDEGTKEVSVASLEDTAVSVDPQGEYVEKPQEVDSDISESTIESRQVALRELGIPESLTDELAVAGLETKDEILKYHEDFTLQSIPGIGPSSEAKILNSLK